jgi:hypothetical protein
MQTDTQFDLNRFDVHNDLFAISATSHLKNGQPERDKRTSSAVFQASAKFTPRYDELKLAELQAMAAYVMANKDATDQMKQNLPDLTPEQTKAVVADLYPHLSQFGEMSVDGDIALNGNATLSSGVLNIDHFDLKLPPYGLAVKGSVTATNNAPSAADMTIVCLSCDAMLSKLLAYGVLANQYGHRFYPNQVGDYLTPQIASGLRTFLGGLAKTVDVKPAGVQAADWVYHISMPQGQALLLNNQPLMQVISDLMSNVASAIPVPNGNAGVNGLQEQPPAAPARKRP